MKIEMKNESGKFVRLNAGVTVEPFIGVREQSVRILDDYEELMSACQSDREVRLLKISGSLANCYKRVYDQAEYLEKRIEDSESRMIDAGPKPKPKRYIPWLYYALGFIGGVLSGAPIL